MIKTFPIPDHYFEGGTPIIEGDKMTYRPVGEQAYELEAAFGSAGLLTMSLTSAYIWGWDYMNVYSAQDSKIVSYDLDKRTVTIDVVLD